MSDERDSPEAPHGSLRSPVRPQAPSTLPASEPQEPPAAAPEPEPALSPNDPNHALIDLRRKTEALVDEYAQGVINRVQFNALYQRYSEQRAIIEKLIERNPGSDAWRQVVSNRGQTGFLRARLKAEPVTFGVFAAGQPNALLTSGERTLESRLPAPAILRAVWAMPNRPAIGLGRKALQDDEWLVMAVGTTAATLVIFSLEPSKAQAQLVRDLHVDFERANQMALARGWLAADRLVFPQRALLEHEVLS